MNAVVKINPNLPAIFRTAAPAVFDEFTHGVQAGFPVISIRGRTWRVKTGGEEQVYLNDQNEAVQSIEVVLVKSNPDLAKIYYEKNYEEGDNSPPRCWSANGKTPDIGVQNPISPSCASCKNNVWGSKITPSGKKTRACADHRRMAVAFRHDIEKAALDPTHTVPVLLLRSPAASLNPLRIYVEDVLQPKGVPPYAVFTKIGFDTSVSHPQLTFRGSQFLNDAQGEVVVRLRESDEVARILAQAEEYSAAGNTGESIEAAVVGSHGPAPAGEAPAPAAAAKPAPAASKPKMKPVEQEELNNQTIEEADDIAPAATEPVQEVIVAAPAPVKAKPKAAAKPKAKEPEPVAAAPATDFDKMLDSLLND